MSCLIEFLLEGIEDYCAFLKSKLNAVLFFVFDNENVFVTSDRYHQKEGFDKKVGRSLPC